MGQKEKGPCSTQAKRAQDLKPIGQILSPFDHQVNIVQTPKQPSKEHPQLVRVDGNTLELSVAFQADHSGRNQEQRVIKLKNGNTITVIVPHYLGQPTTFDLDLVLATFLLAEKNNFQEYKVSLYQLAKALGYKPQGRVIELLKKSIERMAAMLIKVTNYLDPHTHERYSELGFHFYDHFAYYQNQHHVKVKFSRFIEHALQTHYMKAIDYNTALSLKGYAKILYLQIAKLSGDKVELELNFSTVLMWLGKSDQYSKLKPFKKREYMKRFIHPAMEKATLAHSAKLTILQDKYHITFLKTKLKQLLSQNFNQ